MRLGNSYNAIRIILVILFGIYEYWAYKNRKAIIKKISPSILALIIALLILVFILFLGLPAYFFIFVVLIIELALTGTILIVLIETMLSILSTKHNVKKTLILSFVLIFLILIYYLGERVF